MPFLSSLFTFLLTLHCLPHISLGRAEPGLNYFYCEKATDCKSPRLCTNSDAEPCSSEDNTICVCSPSSYSACSSSRSCDVGEGCFKSNEIQTCFDCRLAGLIESTPIDTACDGFLVTGERCYLSRYCHQDLNCLDVAGLQECSYLSSRCVCAAKHGADQCVSSTDCTREREGCVYSVDSPETRFCSACDVFSLHGKEAVDEACATQQQSTAPTTTTPATTTSESSVVELVTNEECKVSTQCAAGLLCVDTEAKYECSQFSKHCICFPPFGASNCRVSSDCSRAREGCVFNAKSPKKLYCSICSVIKSERFKAADQICEHRSTTPNHDTPLPTSQPPNTATPSNDIPNTVPPTSTILPTETPNSLGAGSLELCDLNDICAPGRICGSFDTLTATALNMSTCSFSEPCYCYASDALHRFCESSSNCLDGDRCMKEEARGASVCVSCNGAADDLGFDLAAIDDGAGHCPDEVCIATSLLSSFSDEDLVFKSHFRANVLCDLDENCATAGHILIYKGEVMMMRSYCERKEISCKKRIMAVNSPRMRVGLRVATRSKDLEFTALAARLESKFEEVLLRHLIHLGA